MQQPEPQWPQEFKALAAGAGKVESYSCKTLTKTRPRPSPVLTYESVLIGKDKITPTLTIDGNEIPIPNFTDYEPTTEMPQPREQEDATKVGNNSYSVYDLALCRSGDKGDSANVSVIARRPEYLPYLRKHLTEEVVFHHLKKIHPHSFSGGVETVTRYDWPGINGFNFGRFFELVILLTPYL